MVKRKAAGKKKAPAKKKPTRSRPAAKKVVDKIGKQAAAIGGSAQRAVANFAKSLGEMKIDDDAAAGQMGELGMLLEDVARAKVRAEEKKEEAKTAQAAVDSKTNLLLEKLRGFTHPKSLPLFDAAEREADQKSLLDAAAKGGATDAPAAPAEGNMGL